MASAQIRIYQAGHPTLAIGIPGRARRDLVRNLAVQLRNNDDTDVRSHRWAILGQPDLGNPVVLSNPVSATPTFIPDVPGTYRIRLLVNEGRKGEVSTLLCTVPNFSGKRFPAVAEEGTESNWLDDDTGAPSTRGWQRDMEDLAHEFDNRDLPETTPSAASGGGTAEGTIDLRNAAPVGRLLELTALAATLTSQIELFADVARTILVYQSLVVDAFTTPFEDGTPFALFRPTSNLVDGKVYYRVTNTGGVASAYEIILVTKA